MAVRPPSGTSLVLPRLRRTNRRLAFAVSFLAAMFMTAFTFWQLKTIGQMYWMIPLMGFTQLALFGGYAIFLPELFPTRLRSTGTSFCYNIGRLVAAVGRCLTPVRNRDGPALRSLPRGG